jgi:hypothetical protein
MRRRAKPIDKEWDTRRAIKRNIQEGITILDCTVFSQEHCSEGKFLDQYVRILNRQRESAKLEPVDRHLYHIRSPKRGIHSLDVYLKYALTRTIHISAHGEFNKKNGETVLCAGNSLFELKDLEGVASEWEKQGQDRPLLVVLSACKAGHLDLIRTLSPKGCMYCIAPVFATDWEKAALFSALFYTYLFVGELKVEDGQLRAHPMEVPAAFHKAKTRLHELTGGWKLFKNGEEVS